MTLALEYRPNKFSDLVGHEVLARVLRNAFSASKIPQSILLAGASGVGKTTVARIIALCLNCITGPSAEPCGICNNCFSIQNSNHPDVLEIDAASNTGVDDMRSLLSNSYYLPIASQFKVYIIDEAHMLSNSAFNALLKTLEEPSPHVKFILATTEVRKIPSTIMSRCLQFDLKKLSSAKITERLRFVMKNEGISCEQEQGSLDLIAHAAGGSMRNALSLLEQVSLYQGDKAQITLDAVKSVVGLVNPQIVYDLLTAIILGDPLNSLKHFNCLCESVDPISILKGILQIINAVSCYLITREIPKVFDEQHLIALSQIGKSPVFLSRLWQACLKGLQEVGIAVCSKMAMEMLIIRLCYLSDLPSPAQMIKKLQNVGPVRSSVHESADVQHIMQTFKGAKIVDSI